MANFRKKHTKKSVKCTLCTPFKWMGNSKSRNKTKYHIDKQALMT